MYPRSNIFETAALLRGNISKKQERCLHGLAIKLGKERFGIYRAALRIHTPIPRLSKSEAHKLIEAISRDLEGEQ